jgi:hypothetical protein
MRWLEAIGNDRFFMPALSVDTFVAALGWGCDEIL